MDTRSNNVQGRSGKQLLASDCAIASDLFDKFCNATTLKQILGYHRQLCDVLNLRPTYFPQFYPKLKQHVDSWRAKALWKKFDARAAHKCYNKGKACPNTRVLIIGGGPCGLRTAIEAQLLGAKVVVVEKRDRMSRNNVLHLWPFVIEDLRALGAKKFFGKFCAGSIDHISIRQLQCILTKVALLLGVELHTEVSFIKLLSPPSKEESQERIGWHGLFSPADHPVSQYEFDVLIGADGRRNTLEGFKRKEFRGRLAIAITANFINKRTEAEARVEEISGVAFIFNQKFFKDLYEETGIDLENIVYYKDDTHYFVMTAKKQSLLDKGVILNDIADTSKLLARENVDVEALQNYAREAADFSTNYQMPDLEFAVNHYGNADVTMFDFTSMYAAENASKVVERNGHRLLMILVGDSLLEPFWPTGSGCARGFLSSLDACWAIRGWGSGTVNSLEVLAERESIYRLLGQTTPENLQRDTKSYTLDPSTRYPNLNKSSLLPMQVTSLYDTDDSTSVQQMMSAPLQIINTQELHKKRRRKDSQVHPDTLLQWLKRQVAQYQDLIVENLTCSFKDGLVLCAIIHRYRPDLLDFHSLKKEEIAQNNQIAFDILERELGITPVMTGHDMEKCEVPDFLTMLSYLTQIYDIFRGEIPHIKHPKLDLSEIKKVERPMQVRVAPLRDNNMVNRLNQQQTNNSQQRLSSNRHKRHIEIPANFTSGINQERKTRKRRSADKVGPSLEERTQRLQEIVANRNERMSRRKQQRKMQTEQFIKSMQMLHANARQNDGTPFEDYSIYLYRQTAPKFQDRVKDMENKILYPDRDLKYQESTVRGEKDEEFSGRIKDFEDKLREQVPQEKKPKDLLRAIGKIEMTDWNIKEIEKKIHENKLGKPVNKEKEKVPKWSREQVVCDAKCKITDIVARWRGSAHDSRIWKNCHLRDRFRFLARQTKLEKRGLDRQDSDDKKYAIIDKTLKQLDQKLKEGNIRQQGQNKVSAITEQLTSKQPENTKTKPIQRSNSKVITPAPGGSETCHFCSKRVYLMERLSAEGRFFHRGCFRCQYCCTMLRLGSYMFDKDGKYGHKFYCSQHFGMQGQLKGQKVVRTSAGKNLRNGEKIPDKIKPTIVSDITDRVQTPERIEFSNMSDHEESFSQMDEDEWTDRNFGASTAELGSSDDEDSSSDSSGSESDDDEAYEEALDEPLTKEGTQRLVERWSKRYSKDRGIDSDESEDYDTGSDQSYENSSDDDDSETATEGEEEIRARELRKQEVCVEPPIVQHTDTGSDTEIASDEEDSVSSSEKENSATEITTDSEFDHDDMTPTREIPTISLNDINVSKHRGNYQTPKKVQVKSGELQRPVNSIQKTGNIELTMLPSAKTPQKETTPDITHIKPSPLVNPRKGDYILNRTQSTGGIAAKISLELKKRYLLDTTTLGGNIQRSGSATALDSKLKSFHSNISEHQKLLNPAPEISPTMQAFLQGTSKLHTPLSPSITSKSPTFENKLDQIINEENKKDTEEKVKKELSEIIDDKFVIKPDITKEPKKELPSPEIIDLTLSPNDKFAMQPDITKNVLLEDMHEEKCDSPKPVNDYQPDIIYTNDTEGRPRSPVHETSIIVPEIKWNKPEKKSETDIDTDSLSSENLDEPKICNVFNDIPRVEIHDSSGELLQEDDIMMDSLCIIPEKSEGTESLSNKPSSILSELPKSILSEKKSLNQPKPLPVIENGFIESKCHVENKDLGETRDELKSETRNSSGRSTPVSISDPGLNDGTAAMLTETELSDWARDGAVSDNLEDVEFDINPEFGNIHFSKKSKIVKKKSVPKLPVRMAMVEDFEDSGHVCGKSLKIPSSANGVPIADFDSIEFMDTGSEISVDDIVQTSNTNMLKNKGYVEFVSEEQHKDYIEKPNKGYVNEEENKNLLEIKNPNNNPIVEAINENVAIKDVDFKENTGYCVYGNEDENLVGNFNDFKSNQISCDIEDDSLLNIEGGTTTEDNTCSDSTVKNLNKPNELHLPKEDETVENKNEELPTPVVEEQNISEYDEHIKRLQKKYTQFGFVRDSIDVRKSKRKNKLQSPTLQTDILEMKEPSSSTVSPKEVPISPTFTSPITSRKLDEINKERNKQKDLIHDLVFEKVKSQRRSLDKRRKLRDSFSPSNSPVRTSFDLTKSATVSCVLSENNNSKNLSLSFDSYKLKEKSPIALQKSPTVIGLPEPKENEKENSLSQEILNITSPPSINSDLYKKETSKLLRPLSVNESLRNKSLKEISLPATPVTNPEAFSMPDIHQIVINEFKTPVAPPRMKHDEARKTAEKLKQDAKIRARLMSDEELGLSPEDKLNIHRQKLQRNIKKNDIGECVCDSIETLILNTDKRNSSLFNDTLSKKKQATEEILQTEIVLHNSFSSNDISNKLSLYSEGSTDTLDKRNRTKSVSEICKSLNKSVDDEELKKTLSGNLIQKNKSTKCQLQFYKSDPNLLTDTGKKDKKNKDRERRKSIIKSVTDFFQKKKDNKDVKSPNTSNSSSVKEKFARFRISPKSKEKSKERNSESLPVRRKSLEHTIKDNRNSSPTPPPIPPPPLNYIAANSRADNSGSDDENEWKKLSNSTDTLDKSLTMDGSTNSIGTRRISRSIRKAARQAQIKRHRQAQEIQRKLEETEVKTRELEERGVVIEKVFRGEVSSSTQDEAELLKEWFKLMQDRTELRRYEKELLMRAQELEYEDRHARLQQELRERLTCDDENKTQEDVAAEGAILSEMLEIVAKRDSLIALLEEDRQRYHEEDRDFEAQMLAKGLMLTPIKKNV